MSTVRADGQNRAQLPPSHRRAVVQLHSRMDASALNRERKKGCAIIGHFSRRPGGGTVIYRSVNEFAL